MTMMHASRDVTRPDAPTACRILVVDDHTVFAQLLAHALGTEEDLDCVGTASDVATGMVMAESLRPDIVLMDVRLGDGDGIAAAAALTSRHPALRVVVLSAFVDSALLTRAAGAGVCALLPKDGDLEQMLHVLRTVRRGDFSVEPRLLRTLMAAPSSAPDPGLTARESEVLRMLAAGIELFAIAQELGISINTARGHAKSVLAKLGAHSQLEAVVIALRRGLIHVGPSR